MVISTAIWQRWQAVRARQEQPSESSWCCNGGIVLVVLRTFPKFLGKEVVISKRSVRMLQVTHLRKTYYIEKRSVPAVQGVSFILRRGFYTLLGPSGCGKTPFSGPLRPRTTGGGRDSPRRQNGLLQLNGRSRPTHRRDIGMVFQSYAIWPHMTVLKMWPCPALQRGKHSKKEMGDLVKRPWAWSNWRGRGTFGNLTQWWQQQRVALARALVYQPSLLLLDEPLSNLDAGYGTVSEELKELVKSLHLTILYVTHDQVEALSLSDRIAVMRDGLSSRKAAREISFCLPKGFCR